MMLHEFLVRRASEGLGRQQADGSMPAGHNGSYFHPERPVRNTAHWIALFAKAHEISGEDQFKEAALRCAAYCCSPVDRPHGANHWHRSVAGRDRCNGTIGAAWVIEGLSVAADRYGMGEAGKLASELFLGHHQESATKLWHSWDIDGRILRIDMTFNHQLWLAMAGGHLAVAGDVEAKRRVEAFLDVLVRYFAVNEEGMIRHRIRLTWRDRLKEPDSPLFKLYHMIDPSRKAARGKNKDSMNFDKRDVGYHAFNMQAFAALKGMFPDHSFWGQPSFQKAVDFLLHPQHESGVDNNPFAFPYNPVGFEAAHALQVFRPDKEEDRLRWTWRQIAALGGEKYGEGVDDPETAKARLYEACSLRDGVLEA